MSGRRVIVSNRNTLPQRNMEVDMPDRPWDRFVTDRDRAVFEAAGYRQPIGFGKRPAVLVIDVTYGFCGDRPEPILRSIERWPNSCGEAAWEALPRIGAVIEAARAAGAPVIYTTGSYRDDGWDYGSWRWKVGRLAEQPPARPPNIDGDTIMAEIAPGPRDIIVAKLKPSAFHGTPLSGHLTLLGADSLIVCGATTSGCVRATVLDGFSGNYRITVAEDGCFDRSETSHAINLMDMHAKYADVVPCSDIVAYLTSLPGGLFDLPSGG